MKRKLGSITMALLLSLSLAACGSGEKPADAGASAAGSETTASGAETTAAAESSAPAEEAAPADGGTVANKEKPLVWFNRQPSSSATGQLDMTALNYNKDTYYVGFDANQGAELQGTMVKD